MNSREIVEQIYAEYHKPEYLSIDPLTVVRRYLDSETLPETALTAALLSYGRVPLIIRAAEQILSLCDSLSPEFFCSLSERPLGSVLPDFKYRFHTGGDIEILLRVLADIRLEFDSLTNFVQQSGPHCSGDVLFEWFTQTLKLRAKNYRSLDGGSFDWLLPSPSGGSPCKRIAMFFRWMVRENDGIDCGCWSFISPSLLVIPVDTHVARIAKKYGLTTRNSAGWKMAMEITENLREFDSADPVKYDFSLCREGMLEFSPES